MRAGDLAGAGARYAEALASAKASGDDLGAAMVAGNLAEAEFRGGDAEVALRLAGEALAADRARYDMRGIATSLCNMAAYHIALDRYDEARTHAREALGLLRDVQSEVHLVVTLQHLAAVEALRPDERAAGANDDADVGAGDAGAYAAHNTTDHTPCGCWVTSKRV